MKKLTKKQYYLRTVFSLIVAFLFVFYISPSLFLINTPLINQNFPEIMKAKIEKAFNTQEKPAGNFFPAASSKNYDLSQVIFVQDSSGIYSGEDLLSKQKYLKINPEKLIKKTHYDFSGTGVDFYYLK